MNGKKKSFAHEPLPKPKPKIKKRATSPPNFMSMNSKQEDSNYVSVGSWMGMMFVTAIPVIGLLMVLVWAFSGENQSRKNYYRAILSWLLILVLLVVAAGVAIQYLGGTPAVQKFIQDHQNLLHNQ